MDAVASGRRAHVEDRVANALGNAALDLVMVDQADAHRVDERIALIALVKHNLSPNGGDADAVAVAGDAGDDIFEQVFDPVVLQIAEAQAVHQRHGTRAHGEDVTDDAANARRSSLVRLNRGRMVMGLNLEHDRLVVTDVYDARAFAGPIEP